MKETLINISYLTVYFFLFANLALSETNKNVSDLVDDQISFNSSVEGKIALDSINTTHAIWKEFNSSNVSDLIYFNNSTDSIINLSDLTGANQSGFIDAAVIKISTDDVVHISWMENQNVFYYNSNTGILNLTSLLNDPNGFGAFYKVDTVDMKLDANNKPHILWIHSDGTTFNGDLYYWNGSTEILSNITADLALNSDYYTVQFDFIINSLGKVNIALWTNVSNSPFRQELYHWSSDDHTLLQTITENPPAWFPDVTNDIIYNHFNDQAYITWIAPNTINDDSEVFFYDFNSIQNLSGIVELSKENTFVDHLKLLVDNNGEAYLAWTENTFEGGELQLFYFETKSSAVTNITANYDFFENDVSAPTLALDNSGRNVIVGFNTKTNFDPLDNDYHVYLWDSVTGLTPVTTLDPTIRGVYGAPKLHIDENDIRHVAIEAIVTSLNDNSDILYWNSHNNTFNNLSAKTNLDLTTFSASEPQLIVDSTGSAHIFWSEALNLEYSTSNQFLHISNPLDQCTSDPEKFQAGACGCGFLDLDANNNDIFDCLIIEEIQSAIEEFKLIISKNRKGTRVIKDLIQLVKSDLALSTEMKTKIRRLLKNALQNAKNNNPKVAKRKLKRALILLKN